MSEDRTKDIGEKYQTNPTLETVVQLLGELRQHMDARFDSVDARLDKLERKVGILNDDVLSVRADLAGIDRRVSKLEESPA